LNVSSSSPGDHDEEEQLDATLGKNAGNGSDDAATTKKKKARSNSNGE